MFGARHTTSSRGASLAISSFFTCLSLLGRLMWRASRGLYVGVSIYLFGASKQVRGNREAGLIEEVRVGDLSWDGGIYKGEGRGVLLLHLRTHTLIACVSVPTPMDPIQGHFIGIAICSGEGKGIRVRHGKSKREMASRGRVEAGSGVQCSRGFGDWMWRLRRHF